MSTHGCSFFIAANSKLKQHFPSFWCIACNPCQYKLFAENHFRTATRDARRCEARQRNFMGFALVDDPLLFKSGNSKESYQKPGLVGARFLVTARIKVRVKLLLWKQKQFPLEKLKEKYESLSFLLSRVWINSASMSFWLLTATNF